MSEPTLSPPPRRLRDERGFMLIEVLVSAVILVTASLAIFALLTKSDALAGNQQHRAEAANFAQSELERIRSLPVEDIMKFASDGTHRTKRNKIWYTETAVAKWVSDGGDEPECSGQEGGLDYMRTTVTIAWDGMGQAKPVTLTSLFTPTAGSGGDNGSISIHITNRDGGPDQGITVAVAGRGSGGSYSGTTNVNGCVVFGFIPQDDYDMSFQRAGWVNPDSISKVTDLLTVTAGETTKAQYDYDQGGYTAAKFQTTLTALAPVAGANMPTVSYPPHFQIWQAGQTFPGGFDVDLAENYQPGTAANNTYVSIDSSQNPISSSAWNGVTKNVPLYPFTSPYTIYAGSCPANAVPTNGGATFVNVPNNGGFQNSPPTDIAGLGIQVWSGSGPTSQGTLVGNARVMVNYGCGTWTRTTATTAATAAEVNTNPWVALNAGKSAWGKGTLGDPGFPYAISVKACAYGYSDVDFKYHYSPLVASPNTNMTVGTKLPIYLTAPSNVTAPLKPTTTVGNCQ